MPEVLSEKLNDIARIVAGELSRERRHASDGLGEVAMLRLLGPSTVRSVCCVSASTDFIGSVLVAHSDYRMLIRESGLIYFVA